MKWTIDEATKFLYKLFSLDDSYQKLRWYVKTYSILKGEDNELVQLNSKQKADLNSNISKFKNSLLSYSAIVDKSSDEFRQPIRNISGIYFLIDSSLKDDSQIVYVGQAKSIMNRLSGHFWKEYKQFDKVHYIEIEEYAIDISVLDQFEAYYIWHLGYPEYNKDAGKNDHLVRKMLALAKLHS